MQESAFQSCNTSKMKYLENKIMNSEQTIKFQDLGKCMCIGIVDIVNSTSVAAKLNNLEIAKYYTIFINSITRIIHEHDGIIVKNIGDSLLYFFQMDKHSEILPIECGISMIECNSIINNLLTEEKLPKIQYRVSSEYGEILLAYTNGSVGVDVFGSTVNYCSKINRLAKPNEFIIGHDLKTVIGNHKDYSIMEKSQYKTDLKNNFPIYSVKRR